MSWFTDSSEVRNARRARKWLHQAGTDMAALLDSATDAMWALDARKRFVFGNRAFLSSFREVFGIELEPGMRLVTEIGRRDSEAGRWWSALYDRALGGERVDFEQTYRLGGVDRTFLVSIQPVWRRGTIVGVSALGKDVTALKQTERSLRSGEPVVALGGFVLKEINGQQRMVGFAEDITERKACEERSRRAARFDSIAQLSSGVAHEFNNLLTVILGGVELLRNDRMPQSARRRTLDKIHAAATKAANLTHQLLAFGRRQPLKPVRVDPDALIGDLRALLQKSLGEEIEVRATLAPDLPLLRIDRVRLEEALLALAFNARDAMPHGGVLEFRTRLVDGSIERPDDVPPGPLVELAVSDTGTGMSRETLSRLFEPFFTTRIRGSGLGLPMVQGVVRQSGGFLRVESAPGRGTTVSLYFPPAVSVRHAEQPPRGPEAAAPQA